MKCTNEECEEEMIALTSRTTLVQGLVHCQACYTFYCRRCGKQSHPKIRCQNECSKCHTINPAASVVGVKIHVRQMQEKMGHKNRRCCLCAPREKVLYCC